MSNYISLTPWTELEQSLLEDAPGRQGVRISGINQLVHVDSFPVRCGCENRLKQLDDNYEFQVDEFGPMFPPPPMATMKASTVESLGNRLRVYVGQCDHCGKIYSYWPHLDLNTTDEQQDTQEISAKS